MNDVRSFGKMVAEVAKVGLHEAVGEFIRSREGSEGPGW